MKTIIAGPRDWYLPDWVEYTYRTCPWDVTQIVSGCARGIDTAAIDFATVHGISLKRFPADWELHDNAAGPIRNRQMADYADALIAIWNRVSKGTEDMIAVMKRMNKPVYLVYPGDYVCN